MIYGSSKLFAKYQEAIGKKDFKYIVVKEGESLNPQTPNLINCWEEDFDLHLGTPTPESGKASFLSLQKAVEDLKNGTIDALVTCPIDKQNIQNEEFNSQGILNT